MNKYLVISIIVILLLFVSYLYKHSSESIFSSFPNTFIRSNHSASAPLYLFFVFTRNTCPPCMDIVELLNRLDEHFIVTGIIPEKDIELKDSLISEYNIKFNVVSLKGKKRILPYFNPTIMGVTKSRKILFAIPCVAGMNSFFEIYLNDFYRRAQQNLIQN